MEKAKEKNKNLEKSKRIDSDNKKEKKSLEYVHKERTRNKEIMKTSNTRRCSNRTYVTVFSVKCCNGGV